MHAMRTLVDHSATPTRRSPLIAVTLAVTLAMASLVAGCGARMIPNTDVPDTEPNREVIALCEEYRAAVEERNAAGILRLVSQRYFDDNGTPLSDDDLDYAGLQERFVRWESDVHQVRYEIRYRRVLYDEGSGHVFVDYTYTSHFQVEGVEGAEWRQRLRDNRMELVREDGHLRIVSGI